LTDAAKRDGIPLHSVEAFEALPGRGTKGVIHGQIYHLGNHRLIHEQGQCSDELESRLSALEEQGETVILLTNEHSVHGLFAIADTVKNSSRQAIAELHALGIKTVMLTGDNAHTARAIAAQVGIDEARGDLLPDDKLKAIESKMSKDGAVGMVGDGINDAPALARSDIGFAMGAAGTGTAIETADVALMDDDLRKLPPVHSPVAQDPCSAGAEHRTGAGYQGGVSDLDANRHGHDVDGRVCRCGGEFAGGGEWIAPPPISGETSVARTHAGSFGQDDCACGLDCKNLQCNQTHLTWLPGAKHRCDV